MFLRNSQAQLRVDPAEVSTSNPIAGSSIVAGCSKHQRRREYEFASHSCSDRTKFEKTSKKVQWIDPECVQASVCRFRHLKPSALRPILNNAVRIFNNAVRIFRKRPLGASTHDGGPATVRMYRANIGSRRRSSSVDAGRTHCTITELFQYGGGVVAMFKVRLFGRFKAQANGQELNCFLSTKAKELFCYLLLHRNRPHSREFATARVIYAKNYEPLVLTANAEASWFHETFPGMKGNFRNWQISSAATFVLKEIPNQGDALIRRVDRGSPPTTAWFRLRCSSWSPIRQGLRRLTWLVRFGHSIPVWNYQQQTNR